MFPTLESKLPNTYIFCMKQVEMVCERRRTARFSLLCCGRRYERGTEYASGRERKIRRTLRSLCCPIHNSMGQAERNVRLEEPHISLSCFMGEDRQQGENVRFKEPHVLCAVSYATVWDRQREICGSKNRTFLSPILWEKVDERERMCGSKNHTILSPVSWEKMDDRKRT